MSRIWVISDTHFGHANIIRYCNRPFRSVYEMNSVMRDRWNSVVAPEDKVYHLGDVYFPGGFEPQEAAWDFLKSLHGKKRLILGNHDDAKSKPLQVVFQKIVLWRDFKDLGLLLTHVPVHPSSIIKGRKNVHGHIHNRESPGPEYVNVSVEWTDYKPVLLESLR